MSDREKRAAELQELATTENISLPYPIDVILNMEDNGNYVDLTSGMVGDSEERIDLTVSGAAMAIILKYEDQ